MIASTHLLLAALWHMMATPVAEMLDLLTWAGKIVLFGFAVSTLAVLLIARQFSSGEVSEKPGMRLHGHIADFSKEDDLEGARLQKYSRWRA